MRKALCLSLAAVMSLALVGCGGGAPENKASTTSTTSQTSTATGDETTYQVGDMKDQKVSGVRFQVPAEWKTTKNKSGTLNYYPKDDPSGDNDAISVSYADADLSEIGIASSLKSIASNIKKEDGISNFKTESCTVAGVKSLYATLNKDINGTNASGIAHLIPVSDYGVFMTTYLSTGNGSADYTSVYKALLDSIKLPSKSTSDSASSEDKLKGLEGSALPAAMKTIKKLGYKATYYADGVDFTDFIDSVKDDYVVGKINVNSTDKKVKLDIVTKSSVKSKDAEKKLSKKLESGAAWIAVKYYGEAAYPYGFKLHYLVGQIDQEAEDKNTWYLKAECTVTNEYGVKQKATCEAKVTGTTDSPEVTSFNVY